MPSERTNKPRADQAQSPKRGVEFSAPPPRPTASPLAVDGLEAIRGSDC